MSAVDAKQAYRDMVLEVRQELKWLHEIRISQVRGKETSEDNPLVDERLWNLAAIITAVHNFYLEIRGKEYRHGTEKRFFQDAYNRSCHDKKVADLRERYVDILCTEEG